MPQALSRDVSSGPSRAAAIVAMLLISRSASTPAVPATALSRPRRSHRQTDSALLGLPLSRSRCGSKSSAVTGAAIPVRTCQDPSVLREFELLSSLASRTPSGQERHQAQPRQLPRGGLLQGLLFSLGPRPCAFIHGSASAVSGMRSGGAPDGRQGFFLGRGTHPSSDKRGSWVRQGAAGRWESGRQPRRGSLASVGCHFSPPLPFPFKSDRAQDHLTTATAQHPGSQLRREPCDKAMSSHAKHIQ